VPTETLGERIKRLRLAKGFSIQALAFKIGIGENALRKLESGENKAPSFATGVRLAAALEIAAYDLALGSVMPEGAPAAESHLPEGPIAEAIRALEAQVTIALRTAQAAQLAAEEVKKRLPPRGRRSA